MKKQILAFLQNKNSWRAAIFYLFTLGLGFLGLILIDHDRYQWFSITILPGFGTGVAAALLANGEKKPVTVISILKTLGFMAAITLVMIILEAPIIAVLYGTIAGMVGSFLGLAFCRWENKRAEKNP